MEGGVSKIFNFQRESKTNRPMAVGMPSQLSRDFPGSPVVWGSQVAWW